MTFGERCPWCVDGFIRSTGVMCRTCRGTGKRQVEQGVLPTAVEAGETPEQVLLASHATLKGSRREAALERRAIGIAWAAFLTAHMFTKPRLPPVPPVPEALATADAVKNAGFWNYYRKNRTNLLEAARCFNALLNDL